MTALYLVLLGSGADDLPIGISSKSLSRFLRLSLPHSPTSLTRFCTPGTVYLLYLGISRYRGVNVPHGVIHSNTEARRTTYHAAPPSRPRSASFSLAGPCITPTSRHVYIYHSLGVDSLTNSSS